jgi:hypothetical protein
MKIELVGGPECGNVREVRYLEQDFMFGGWVYRRRDVALTLSGKHGGLYGERGNRMYDAMKDGWVND